MLACSKVNHYSTLRLLFNQTASVSQQAFIYTVYHHLQLMKKVQKLLFDSNNRYMLIKLNHGNNEQQEEKIIILFINILFHSLNIFFLFFPFYQVSYYLRDVLYDLVTTLHFSRHQPLYSFEI